MALTLDEILKEAQEIVELQDKVKSHAMYYQYDLKCEVSKAMGLTFEEVDLPYEQWTNIRNEYLKSIGKFI